jgi:Ca2+:H+ antiporter
MAARWTVLVPLLALIPLALTWGTHPSTPVVVIVGLFLAGSVLAAVHHAITIAVGTLTVVPGRATLQQGGVHLVLFGAFVFLAVNP